MRAARTLEIAVVAASLAGIGSCSSSSSTESGEGADAGIDAAGGGGGAVDAAMEARAGEGGGGAGGQGSGGADAATGAGSLAERLCGRYDECGLIQLPLEACILTIGALHEMGDAGSDSELCASTIRAFDVCRAALSCTELTELEDYGDRCQDAGGLAGYPYCAAEAVAVDAACGSYSPDCL